MEKSPLLISTTTAINFGFPVLNKVFKVLCAKILFQEEKCTIVILQTMK